METKNKEFSYVDTSGELKNTTAPDASSALKTAYNIAPNSGVISPTVITDANIRESTIPDIDEKIGDTKTDPESPEEKPEESTASPYQSIMDTYGLKGTSQSDVDDSVASDPTYSRFSDLSKKAQASNDREYSATLNSIKSNTTARMRRMQQGGQELASALFGSGASRYAPGGAINAKTTYDVGMLEDIQNKESEAIAAAQKAHSDRDYQLADSLLEKASDLRKEKLGIAKGINEKISEENKTAENKIMQASRDAAIGSLIEQGVTDPTEILSALDEAAKASGYSGTDFTAEEVQKAIKDLKSDSPTDKLSGNLRDYFILKEVGSLPDAISSLPEEKQLNAWINYTKPKKVPGVGSVNKITLSEAKSQKLPLSVVGMSEDELVKSFSSEEPPQWFVEKANSEAKKALEESEVVPLWEEYKNAYNSQFKQEDDDTEEADDNETESGRSI